MTPSSPQSFFEHSFSEIAGTALANGTGGTIRQIAVGHPTAISLSTLKKVEAGKHIRPAPLKVVAKLYGMTPLDWIETKICYIEAHMNEYLVPPTPANRVAVNIDSRLLNAFGALRSTSFAQFGSRIHALRLEAHVRQAFVSTNKTPMDVCDKTGGPQRKKDKHTVKYPTVTALGRAEAIRPEKLAAICHRLNLPRNALFNLKIAHAEVFLGEYLLGDDMNVFARVSEVNRPRTVSLLIYSTQNAAELA